MADHDRAVEHHYRTGALGDAILAALGAMGKDLDALTPADLAPVDAFHIRGREATEQLAARVALSAGMHVLDVGSGIGGTARYLAAHHGCRVTGCDLTDEYCRVAMMLSERTRLGHLTEFRRSTAARLPFADGTFDVAWTEHVQMNVADKRAFYSEIARVLKPGGALAFHDIFQGPGGAPHFPVPWAREPSISFLVEPDEMQSVTGALGLRVRAWEDLSDASAAWFRAIIERGKTQAPSPLGLHLVLGTDGNAMLANMLRNLDERRLTVVQGVLGRA